MSLINNANPGSQIDLMCAILRFLSRSSIPVPEEKLLAICRPEALSLNDDQKSKVPGELRFWSKEPHQLWQKNDLNEYELRVPELSKDPSPLEISKTVRRILMQAQIQSFDPISKDLEDVDKLMAILSCVLVASGHPTDDSSYLNNSSLQELLTRFLTKDLLPNSSEVQPTLAYCWFLGFLEVRPSGRFAVDPTRAILESLSSFMTPGKPMLLSECMQHISELIPVIDEGRFSRQVQEIMIGRGFQPAESNTLSKSLSHAFYRLRVSQRIKLEQLSDDPRQMTLNLPIGKRSFSLIQLQEVNKT